MTLPDVLFGGLLFTLLVTVLVSIYLYVEVCHLRGEIEAMRLDRLYNKLMERI